ncbi:MAG: hypothetical protein RLZZ450_4272 [Pseudomonadota bacterium]|jgi:uncharacterized cupredoxin-like copper-binding protein
MRDLSPFVRTFLLSCGLLVVAACGDDPGSDAPAVDSGVPASGDAAVVVDAGEGHDHGADAALADASTSVADAGVNPACTATISLQDYSYSASRVRSRQTAACTATISLQDYKLVPDKPTAKAGTIVLCAKNDGKAPHDLGLRGADMATLQKTPSLAPGESARITLTLAPGSFAIYCSQAGHESLGMKGTLTVE